MIESEYCRICGRSYAMEGADICDACIEILNGKKASEHHIKCHDCGQFLPKERWVPKDHPWKAHGLCRECFNLYDDPNFL